MKNVICPACGAEFEPTTEPIKVGTWTEQEDAEILSRYKNREKILKIADKLGRTPDAVRNRLYILRNNGERVNVTVSLSAAEYDEMRAAFKTSKGEINNTRDKCADCVSRFLCSTRNGSGCLGKNDKETFIGILKLSTPGIDWDGKIEFLEKLQREAAELCEKL